MTHKYDRVRPFFCGGPLLVHHGIGVPPPPLQPHEWAPVLHWQGLTWGVLSFRVTVKSAKEGAPRIEWRRWGGSVVPYSSGAFSNSTEFHVFPGELFLRFDIRSSEPGLEVTIEQIVK